jgi:hypothetical protein
LTVQEPGRPPAFGWFADLPKNAGFRQRRRFLLLSGRCSETEVSEHLIFLEVLSPTQPHYGRTLLKNR